MRPKRMNLYTDIRYLDRTGLAVHAGIQNSIHVQASSKKKEKSKFVATECISVKKQQTVLIIMALTVKTKLPK